MLEDQLYREELLEIFKDPQNKGTIPNADFEAKLSNPICGDEVKIQIKLGNGRVIQKALFSGDGCAISLVSASLLTRHVEGKKLAEIRAIGKNDILGLIGISPTPARLGCALLSLDTLREALKDVVESKSR